MTEASKTSLGVVIVTHNSLGVVEDAVSYLNSDADPSSRHEIWIVDSGSSQGMAPPGNLPGCDRVLRAANYGYGTSVNLAISVGLAADWIVVMNPDTRISLRALNELVLRAEIEGVSVAAPVLDSSPTGGHYIQWPTPPWRRRPTVFGPASGPIVKVAAVQGSVFAIRFSAFMKLGGFDDGFFLYSEEIDLCRRANSAGFAVAFVPSISAIHVGEASSAGVEPSWRLAERIRGKRRYFAKYYSRAEAVLATVVDVLGAGRRLLEVVVYLQKDPREGLPWPPRIEPENGY